MTCDATYVASGPSGMQTRDCDVTLRKSTSTREVKMSAIATVQDCEDYIEQNGIQAILKECIAKICQDRPDKPFKWLREYFEKLEKVLEIGGGCAEKGHFS